MQHLLLPVTSRNIALATLGVLVVLASSAALLAIAPLAMPEGYSWVSNAISESAAQGLHGAWIARLGLLLFGLAALWLAAFATTMWARAVVWFHTAFGVFMTGTAAFSHRPWLPGAAVVPFEDFLHSVTATGMGFAFTFGVLARLLQRDRSAWGGRVFDVIAITAATVIPLAMLNAPGFDGLLQRLMFLTAYLWYAREALSLYAANR